MAQQVKTPRFYVDIPTFLHATGQSGWDSGGGGAELLYMNPSNPFTKEIQTSAAAQIGAIGSSANNTPKTAFPVNFCALLNHNLGSNNNNFKLSGKYGLSSTTEEFFRPNVERFNANGYDNYIKPNYNGTTLFTIHPSRQINDYWRSFSIWYDTTQPIDIGTHQLGSLVIGKYWDAPNSPDLNLTMERRFDGIKRQKTIEGKTIANIYYDGPTEWTMNNRDEGVYKYPPFELDSPISYPIPSIERLRAKSGLGKKGLRSWKLSFSYISESDMWMANETSNTIIADDTISSDPNPMLSDNSFNFVWNCTLGGTLPFIFQPNNATDSNGDFWHNEFAKCTFRNNTLSVKQVSNKVYSLNIIIDEVS